METPDKEGALRERYETVIDLVERGADPEGGASILPLLEEHGGDDTLLVFPEGRYLMDGSWFVDEFSNLGIYGENATIVPPEGYQEPALFVLGGFAGATDLYVDGLHFDFTHPTTAPPPIVAKVADGLLVRDVSVAGKSGRTQFDVLEPDGTGRVENLRLPDGGLEDAFPPGCYVSEYNRGELTLRDFSIANFPNNGIYASSSTGPVRVVGGRFEDNDISNVRVGDDGLVRGVDISCADPEAEAKNMRGVWIKGANATVEDCTVRFDSVGSSDGAVVIHDGTTVRDTRIRIDADGVAGILGKDPETSVVDADPVEGVTTVERVDVEGAAANGSAVNVLNHDGCVFDAVSIVQSGENRNGFEFYRVADATIRNPSIDVTGEPIVRRESTVQTLDF